VSTAPAHMDETATAALAVAEEADEAEDDGDVRSRKASNDRRIGALKAQVARVCASNSTLREANATLCHALRQSNLPIPAGAEQTAQALGEQIAAGQTPIMAGIAPPAPDKPDLTEDTPMDQRYYLRQLYLPDTSTIQSSTKYKLNGNVWPHAIATYERRQDVLAPIVECRARQVIEFQLHDRKDCKKKVTERVLKPDSANLPIINFKLDCVYDDTGEKVTIANLAQDKINGVRALANPTCLNQEWTVPMENGRVRFVITEIHFRSQMTDPIHRKFRYKLAAVNEEFSFLNIQSPSFWVVSKVSKVTHKNVVPTLYTQQA
jgi:hypothetical protein